MQTMQTDTHMTPARQPAPVEVVRNDWGLIISHGDLLELRWLPSTSSMTDGGFMATLCLFAFEAERMRPNGLFIDATEFNHRFGAGVMDWRDAHIIPRYGAAGVRRFTFLMPPGFPQAGSEAVEGPAIFPTKWFVGRQEALTWLRSDRGGEQRAPSTGEGESVRRRSSVCSSRSPWSSVQRSR